MKKTPKIVQELLEEEGKSEDGKVEDGLPPFSIKLGYWTSLVLFIIGLILQMQIDERYMILALTSLFFFGYFSRALYEQERGEKNGFI